MALWNKLQTELDRFGRAAQSAFDEGKARLEILRVRQLADKAAQALGYAVYHARKEGGDLDAETYARLSSTLAAHEAEAQRLEAQMDAARAARGESMEGDATGSGGDAGATGASDAASGGAAGGATGGVDPAMGDMGGSGSSAPGASGPGASGSSGASGSGGGHAGGTPPYSGPQGGGSPSW